MPELARGLAATLFERLSGQDAASERAFLTTEEGVQASIARELSRLFNTCRPQGCGVERGLPPTVIDYGIPDFTSLHVANPDARDRLAESLEQAIGWFESRLRDPRVRVLAPLRPGGPMIARVSGAAVVGSDIRRVEFDMDL